MRRSDNDRTVRGILWRGLLCAAGTYVAIVLSYGRWDWFGESWRDFLSDASKWHLFKVPVGSSAVTVLAALASSGWHRNGELRESNSFQALFYMLIYGPVLVLFCYPGADAFGGSDPGGLNFLLFLGWLVHGLTFWSVSRLLIEDGHIESRISHPATASALASRQEGLKYQAVEDVLKPEYLTGPPERLTPSMLFSIEAALRSDGLPETRDGSPLAPFEQRLKLAMGIEPISSGSRDGARFIRFADGLVIEERDGGREVWTPL